MKFLECSLLVQEGDPAVVARVVREFHSPGQVGSLYEFIDTLVRYYQMVKQCLMHYSHTDANTTGNASGT